VIGTRLSSYRQHETRRQHEQREQQQVQQQVQQQAQQQEQQQEKQQEEQHRSHLRRHELPSHPLDVLAERAREHAAQPAATPTQLRGHHVPLDEHGVRRLF